MNYIDKPDYNNLFFHNILAVNYQPLKGFASFELEDYSIEYSGITNFVFIQNFMEINNSYVEDIEAFPIEEIDHNDRSFSVKSKHTKKETIQFNYCVESTLSLWLIAAEKMTLVKR